MTTAFYRAKHSTTQKHKTQQKVSVDSQILKCGWWYVVYRLMRTANLYQQYIWLGDIGNRVMKNVAKPGDAAKIDTESNPESLKALKK